MAHLMEHDLAQLMEQATCLEKLNYIAHCFTQSNSEQQMMKCLWFDHIQQDYDFERYDSKSLHSQCLGYKRSRPGHIYLTIECTDVSKRFDELCMIMKDMPEEEKKRKFENEKELLDKETVRKRQEAKKAKKKRNKEKKRKEVEIAVRSKTDEASVEKVKMKASLRSKISQLEIEEEQRKLALASAIEEKNKASLALENMLVVLLEEKDELEVEIVDIEAAMKSLVERKRKLVEKQKEVEEKVQEVEEKKKDSEKLTAAKIKDWTKNIENVQEELKVVQLMKVVY